MRHINYLKYVVTHKWFVFCACLKIGASPWRGFVHDLSKYRLSEWLHFARCFYGPDGKKQFSVDNTVRLAWNHHQKRNKHHWQYWIIISEAGQMDALPMPRLFILEMVADWMAMARINTGKWSISAWYERSNGKMILHRDTRREIDRLFEQYEILKEG